MSTLRIRFAPYVADSGAAIVPLRILGRDWKQIPGNWDLRLDNSSVDVTVPEGDFTVQAFLPTGEVISGQVSVGANATADIALTPELASPQESLAWSYLLKGTSRTSVPKHLTSRLNLSVYGAPALQLWELSTGYLWKPSSLPHPALRSAQGASFGDCIVHSGEKLVWLRVAWSTVQAKYVALPPAATVRINLFHDAPDSADRDPINVVVDAGNPRAESILGYLTRGDFASARQVGASFNAEELLRDKVADPASAAIGAYFLLQAGDLDRLYDWTRNLSDWFSYFPDGAVIRAWHLLRSSTPDFEGAQKLFIEAVRRGIPVYTIGLRLLRDGLAVLSARAAEKGYTSDDLKHAFDIISSYAAATDWTAATSSIYGIQAGKPRRL